MTNLTPVFLYFFLPFLPLVLPVFEAFETTLDALEGAAELALLDFTLSSALFCPMISLNLFLPS